MKIKRPARRGFTLFELTIALGLLGTFAAIATHLFTGTFKLFRQNAQSIETPIRFDAAIVALRADMQSASAIELPRAESLVIHDRAGSEVRWNADGKKLTRADSIATRDWAVGQRLQFVGEGALLLVHSQDSGNSTADIAMAPGGKASEGDK